MPGAGDSGKTWTSPLEFVLTTMGFAIGLGNVWRFPYLVYRHGGTIFLLVYVILLLVLGVPVFFLETCIGQFSRLNPVELFAKAVPITEGLGYAAAFMNSIIGFFYNLIMCYCLYYFFVSFRAKLPWTDCGIEPECFKANLSDATNCSLQLEPYIQAGIKEVKSPSEIYFYNKVLQLSEGIDHLDGMDYPLPLLFLLAWIIVFVGLLKSIKTLGKISYFTTLFPYVIITVLIFVGATLRGASKGIEYYIFNFDFKKLSDFTLYQDAAVQAFFSLGACGSGLTIMSTFNKFNNNILRDSIIVPFMDAFTGFYCGFAIFAMLGHMFLSKCVDSFDKVAKPGPELVFIIYPDAISLIGTLAPLVSILFFLMMLSLGFGSQLSCIEIMFDTLTNIINRFTPVTTTFRQLMIRLITVLVFFLLGLTLVTRAGFHILEFFDAALFDFAFLLIGLLELIILPWIYGDCA